MEYGLALAFIIIIVGLVVFQIVKDRTEFPKFVALEDTRSRQAYFRKSLGAGILKFSVLGALGIVLLGYPETFFRFPEVFAEPFSALISGWGLSADNAMAIGIGATLAYVLIMVVLTLIPMFMEAGELPTDGVFAMLPRNGREMRLTAALSVNAGIGEEFVFRVLLPMSIVIVTGSLPLGLGVAFLLFGGAHGYQGVTGVITTSLVGLFFLVIYFCTGALWLVIVLHILTDIRGLVILPLILKWSERFDTDGKPLLSSQTSQSDQ